MAKRQTVLVAMSGGVDSAVAAGLMKQRGHDVIGITMQIWQESQTDPRHSGCCSLGAVEDARRVARVLDIPHYVIDFKSEFRQSVIQNFIDEYSAGRTPNPCVQCNKHVKFDELLRKMHELGCDTLVTGHYARIRRRADGRYVLMQARGLDKDQSYVLYMLGQEELRYIRFPLGDLPDKSVTRQMARDMGLPVANKPDSQEICFVSEAGGYREFLRKHKPEAFESGEMVDSSGKVVAHHEGIAAYTVGQRRGLRVAQGEPLYVLQVLPKENRIVVGSGDELLTKEVPLMDVAWGAADDSSDPVRVQAKIRYNMDPKPATLIGGAEPRIVFDDCVRAVTPGQMAVAYLGKTVAAGGVIVAKSV